MSDESASPRTSAAHMMMAKRGAKIAEGLSKRRDSLSILLGNRPTMDLLKDRNIVRDLPMANKIKATKIQINLKLSNRPAAQELEQRGILIAAQEVMKRRKERRDSISMFLEARPSMQELQRRNILRENQQARKALEVKKQTGGIKKSPSNSLLAALGTFSINQIQRYTYESINK
jgi:hypothetical protein